MNAWLVATLIGVSVFILVIVGYFVIRTLMRQRRRGGVYKPSFVRADLNQGKETDQMRGTGALKDRSGREGRGRFYAFGVLIAAVFGTLAVKLWSLQVLGHDNYVQLSTSNMTSEVPVPANRGRILDRNGNELVSNRPSITISGKRGLAEDTALVHRLSLVLGIPVGIIRRNLLDDSTGYQSDHIIASDVPMKSIAYIREHPTLFGEVTVESHTVRYYPYGSLAAHVLGYTGPVTEDFLAGQTATEDNPYYSGDIIGIAGVEATYEHILRGTSGTKTYVVDAYGNPYEEKSRTEPESGNDVVLTIDAELQRRADEALRSIITMVRAHEDKPSCDAGAIVCIDLADGGILAASSYPTYFPAELSRGISTELWTELTNDESAYPLTNRVVSGLYPAASTFKAFTSLAGLEYGMINDDTSHYCDGYFDEYGEEWGQRCWIHPAGHGTLGLEDAIRVSCDIFFYSVGAAFYEQWYALGSESLPKEQRIADVDRPNPFQEYVRTWGFGSPTGVDMPGEAAGYIPDAAWKRETFSDTPEESLWQPGDMTNMSIGQGDILITPLQLCNAYGAIARQKFIVPHVFYQVINNEGRVIKTHEPEVPTKQPVLKPEFRARLIDGFKRVVANSSAFNGLEVDSAGKTGTAEVAGKEPFVWYVGFAPADEPRYCAACVIEQGGNSSQIAAIGVVQVFAQLFGVPAPEIKMFGASRER